MAGVVMAGGATHITGEPVRVRAIMQTGEMVALPPEALNYALLAELHYKVMIKATNIAVR
jgi:hypothetical protein